MPGSQLTSALYGISGYNRVTELSGSKVKVNFLRFTSGRLISITDHLISVKNVNFVGTLSFCDGEKNFRFKELLELAWTLVYVFYRSMV